MRKFRLLAPLMALAAAVPAAAALAQAPGPAYTGSAVRTVTGTLVDSTGKSIGNVQLNQDAKGVVQVTLDASQLPAGAHGIHIHAVGVCEGPAFTSAAAHFNPGNRQHGLNNAGGPHAGDLPQIETASLDQGMYRGTTDRVSLTGGANSIFDADGSALVVHAAADDQVTDPTGNSGGRIACAVLAAPDPALATRVATPAATPRPPATGTGTAQDGTAILPIVVLGALVLAGGAVAVSTRRR